ncbi:MAG: hypothetical protein Q9227_008740 [Pyrenula ochraceoflavens]
MNFELPRKLQDYLDQLEDFIKATILPLQSSNDNDRYFDHRREHSRTDWDHQGLPRAEWENLLTKARNLADDAGFYRFPLPTEYGGAGHVETNLWMCAIRYHLASHDVYGGGLSLANDLQNEHSVVGNFPDLLMLIHFGSSAQKAEYIPKRLNGTFRMTFGLTEPDHGSDATHMATTAALSPSSSSTYLLNGTKKWQTGAHSATHFLIFARTTNFSRPGSAHGITAFLLPRSTPGLIIDSYQWTLNMPTDHATITLTNAPAPTSTVLGTLHEGLSIAQTFVHENRLRQASSSCGAAAYCLNRTLSHAKSRKTFGRPLSANQAIQFPLVELATQIEMLHLLILRTAVRMDAITQEASPSISSSSSSSLNAGASPTMAPPAAVVVPWVEIEKRLGAEIAMCNYYANRLACQAADRAIQVHGGMGYSRHLPFEHIWRHFRRYRITEGSEEIQMRKVAGRLFGILGRGEKETGKDKCGPKEEKKGGDGRSKL